MRQCHTILAENKMVKKKWLKSKDEIFFEKKALVISIINYYYVFWVW